MPHWAFALQISQNLGCKLLPQSRAFPMLQQNLLCPTNAQATIVLPDFIRSRSAEGRKKNMMIAKYIE
ncbi:MAG TPA: hypothetical protein VK668_01250 [Mucilaginibacter sp.]|nr:hypothetical protein [Mucilaginibacter sp.]